jgi:hypothetical protein
VTKATRRGSGMMMRSRRRHKQHVLISESSTQYSHCAKGHIDVIHVMPCRTRSLEPGNRTL